MNIDPILLPQSSIHCKKRRQCPTSPINSSISAMITTNRFPLHKRYTKGHPMNIKPIQWIIPAIKKSVALKQNLFVCRNLITSHSRIHFAFRIKTTKSLNKYLSIPLYDFFGQNIHKIHTQNIEFQQIEAKIHSSNKGNICSMDYIDSILRFQFFCVANK